MEKNRTGSITIVPQTQDVFDTRPRPGDLGRHVIDRAILAVADDQPPVAKNARRQPSTTTKKAPVRKQSTAAAAADGPPKPKQSKSRNGIFSASRLGLFNRV